MEELQAKHRKESKELQGRITQKKKGASKKTRKGVNDECETLERELRERQAAEIAALRVTPGQDGLEGQQQPVDDLVESTTALSLDASAPSHDPMTPDTPDEDDAQETLRKKPNRAKARIARRAAEQEALFNQAKAEASNLPDLKRQERERMLAEFKARGLVEKEIRADGHCLYSAFADQMDVLGLPLGTTPGAKASILGRISNGIRGDTTLEQARLDGYKLVRKTAAEYIQAHPDDFAPFLEEPLPEYVHKVRDTGEWGGQLELLALAKSYGVKISVLQGDGRVEDIAAEAQDLDTERIWLAYYRHGFGLGEHYNSLRKAA